MCMGTYDTWPVICLNCSLRLGDIRQTAQASAAVNFSAKAKSGKTNSGYAFG